MHRDLAQAGAARSELPESMRQYLIAMATVLETYFRDLCVHVLSTDASALARVEATSQFRRYRRAAAAIASGAVPIAEIAVGELKFQNIQELEESVSVVIGQPSYIAALSSFVFHCGVPARRAHNVAFCLDASWSSDLQMLFEQRHALVHDANFKFRLTTKEMQRIESTAVLVPQLTSAMVNGRKATPAAEPSGWIPALMLVEDLISDDWEVLEEDSVGGASNHSAGCAKPDLEGPGGTSDKS